MKACWARVVFATVLAAGLPIAGASAEDGIKTLPTLLIKGEVVSLDSTDPAANLLKVKDRYGFETPIFLTSETKINKGAETEPASSLTAGTPVEVEYNFDVNTAKRHAVSVKVATPPAAEAAPATSAAPMAVPGAASDMPAESVEAPAAPASTEPAASEPPAAPVAESAPAAPAGESMPQSQPQ